MQTATTRPIAAQRCPFSRDLSSGMSRALYDGDVGFDLHSGNGGFLRREPRLRGRTTAAMSTWELILGSAGAVLLTAYLVYALLRPERF
jgi:K+-transporting ATPase KdpF subunit